MRADFQLAMQILDKDVIPPAATAAGTTNKEGAQMDLKTLLAANPTAQAEFDAAITAAEAKGKVAGKEEAKLAAKEVANFLANPNYPKQVGEMAIKVLTGDQPQSSLQQMVATADMILEMQKGQGAAAGTAAAGETPAQTPPAPTDATNVADEAGLEAAIQLAKGGN